MAVLTVQQFKWDRRKTGKELIICVPLMRNTPTISLTHEDKRGIEIIERTAVLRIAPWTSLFLSFFLSFSASPSSSARLNASSFIPRVVLLLLFLSSSARVAQFDCLEGLRRKEKGPVLLTEHSNLNYWMNHGNNLYHTADLLTSQSALIMVHNLMDNL